MAAKTNGNGHGAAVLESVKERVEAMDWATKLVVFESLNGTSDWAEALEIGRQRMERRAEAAKQTDTEGYGEHMRQAAQEYARFAEIYSTAFGPLEEILRVARHGVASQIMAEFPNDNDAAAVAGHLRANTPREWLGEFDSSEI